MNTNDIEDQCPSILDVLGFLKFPDIKPIELTEPRSDKQITEILTASTQKEAEAETEPEQTSELEVPTELTLSTISQKGKGYKTPKKHSSTKSKHRSSKRSSKKSSTKSKRRSTKPKRGSSKPKRRSKKRR